MENIVEKFAPHPLRELLPGIAPFVVGVLMYSTSLVPLMSDALRQPFLVCAFLVSMAATALMSYAGSRRLRGKVTSWRVVMAAVIFVSGAFLLHLLAGTPVARFAIVTLAMLALLWLVMRTDSVSLDVTPPEKLVVAARQLDWLGAFFLCVFAFGLLRYADVTAVVVAAVIGLLQGIIAYESSLDTEVTSRFRLLVSGTVGLLGLEMFVGLSFLPTSFAVNAAVAVVAHFAVTRLMVRLLGGDAKWRELGGGIVVAVVLLALVLGTAKWV